MKDNYLLNSFLSDTCQTPQNVINVLFFNIGHFGKQKSLELVTRSLFLFCFFFFSLKKKRKTLFDEFN